MTLHRVAITGVGAITPLGGSVAETCAGLAARRCGTQRMAEWDAFRGLNCRVGAPANLPDEMAIPRQHRRTMSRMSLFAALAARQALADARIDLAAVAGDPRVGCVIGHTTGSPATITETYETLLPTHDISLLTASKFFQCLSHTATLNVSAFLGIRGVVMATSAACASGLQAVGTAYDLIRLGRQDVVLCGGAEELHPTVAGSFDILYATSSGFNESPQRTPRPFDRDRDGLVCGEGAGILVLEDFVRAVQRGVPIHGEVLGYHTCGNGSHVSQSTEEGILMCVQGALADAGLAPRQIDYVNAHATGTPQGDAAEAAALKSLFGDLGTPISALKGYLGHTLGASGAIELALCLDMMRRGVVCPTHNLDHVAPDCAGLNHVLEPAAVRIDRFLKNSFAFGGINAALVCGRVA